MRILLLSILILSASAFAQVENAYVIYNSKGKKTTYKKMIASLEENKVIMFGELHDNPIAHWLQLELTKTYLANHKLVLGAEMMEADNQKALSDYLAGSIDQKGLDSLARLWPNYKTDYKPLIDLAKASSLPFIATNIPRRFASKVYRGGFEALQKLSDEEKAWVAPLPFPYDAELPRYQNILAMMGDHGTPELVMAQASKDATMAHFIFTNLPKDGKFIHYNGAYHSDYYEGICWYLKQLDGDLSVGTISTVSQKDISKLEEEHLGRADFIICVDEDMTSTH